MITRRRAGLRASGRRDDRGFGLVEVMIALALISGLAAGLATVFLRGMQSAAALQNRQTGVTLAEEVAEAAGAVSTAIDVNGCIPLLNGRFRADVEQQWTRIPSPVDLSTTDPAWNPAGCPAEPAVPFAGADTPVADDDITPATVRLGADYVVRNFLGVCYQPRQGGECVRQAVAPVDAVRLYRLVVWVQWRAGCDENACRFVLTELIDPTPDPVFNSRDSPDPVAVADTFCTTKGETVMLTLVANDTGALGAAPVLSLTNPIRGTLGPTLDTGYVAYQPNPSAVSVTDTFSYRLESIDGRLSNATSVNIDIRAPGGCP